MIDKTKNIFLTGTFDILHRGHIEFMKYAKSHGDHLTVAIDKDSRVKQLKGSSRPFNNEKDRMFIIGSIKYVDEIALFGSDHELIHILQYLHPDIWFAGSDWEGKDFPGKEYAKEIRYFTRIEPYSTTRILNEIRH